ncbi:MAG: biotin/lipoyl-containing protein [Anaerolineales bacterium]
MKYTVRIAQKTYEVEIKDIHARPVLARVDGQEFEVNPENATELEARAERSLQKEAQEIKSFESLKPRSSPSLNVNEMRAPLPGTVTEVFVKAGDQIESGQVIVVIEAMKMKNSIRSIRAGRIAEVLVSANQTVAHKQIMVRFG